MLPDLIDGLDDDDLPSPDSAGIMAEIDAMPKRWRDLVYEFGYVIGGTPVFTGPEWDALHEFDAANHVEPLRTIAERIVAARGIDRNHPLVDEISNALEDAMTLGARRAPYERRAKAQA